MAISAGEGGGGDGLAAPPIQYGKFSGKIYREMKKNYDNS
jgi:hypothetical protein